MDWKIKNVFPSEEDFGTDPYGYRVYGDGELLAEYGDDYHDNGGDKSLGFIDGWCKAKGIERKYATYEDVVDESIG